MALRIAAEGVGEGAERCGLCTFKATARGEEGAEPQAVRCSSWHGHESVASQREVQACQHRHGSALGLNNVSVWMIIMIVVMMHCYKSMPG